MFATIKTMWREARATVLIREVDDLLQRLQTMQGTVVDRVMATFAAEFSDLATQTANFENASVTGRKLIADRIRSQARQQFDLDVGRGVGLALLAAYIELIDLQETEAEFTKGRLQRLLDVALRLH